MKIAIIGAGHVGQALAEGWAKAGHEVIFGVRDPAKGGPGDAPRKRVPEAAAGAEVVVLATPWREAENAIRAAGGLAGKIVIDCTNPLGPTESGLGLVVGFSTSAGEAVAGWATGAAVFKTLNQCGFAVMRDARAFGPPKPVMFVAGNDEAKKPVVMSLVGDLGFEAADGGPLRNARLLEPLAMAWIDRSMSGRDRDFAFALTRKK
ncbi:MAG TPA: NAD(P)-binding domain-containing protein [Hyphomicrobiales bacterium]|nr:NAD(P)-binding domain-containing protein [Hyphomicrobiales bacterium]